MIKEASIKLDRVIFGHFQNHSHKILAKEIIGSCETLLDLGCGASSPIQEFAAALQYTVGVDYFKPSLKKSEGKKIHDEYRLMNVLEIDTEFEENSFDCVLAYDLIEHLSKEDGLKLISMMERVARKKVIVYTPNGFLPQRAYDGNQYQIHLSGWEIEEMKAMSFRVIGINGWKTLRGERAQIRWRPTFFWRRISFLTQIITTKYPRYAFQILCIKEMLDDRHSMDTAKTSHVAIA
ncbi:MAG: class I SAM-dependent methyltransferase [Fidelibacterota bacterium]|nr:MAG: class I SAM-dependent methyltransferase [Candidatus Neomarinimicrobiota bacterium]